MKAKPKTIMTMDQLRLAQSKDKLLQRLMSAYRAPVDTIPAGWKTQAQWAEHWGLQKTTTRRIIAVGMKRGLMKTRTFRVDVGKLNRLTPHFCEVKK